ncbi:MAG: hypothetical protein ACREF3_15090, partial [Acetobacteraceae bacterium]
LDLAREVSRRRLNIPILLTSGYGGGMTGRLAAANLPFLRKPYTLAALESALSQAIAQTSEFASWIKRRAGAREQEYDVNSNYGSFGTVACRRGLYRRPHDAGRRSIHIGYRMGLSPIGRHL